MTMKDRARARAGWGANPKVGEDALQETIDDTETPHLSAEAARHLWMHFSRMGSYQDHEVPVIVRGEGAYVWDQHGKRYLDGLAGLFTSQLGHGRTELAEAGAKQAGTLAYFPLWTYAHPRAIELAERLAGYTPGDLNRVFFTTGGSEAVESAWKLARQYFRITGQPQRTKAISRTIAYHGTSLGALSITGIPELRTPFEPLVPGAIKVPNTNFYRAEIYPDDEVAFGRWAADEIERAIEREGADTVAAVFLEPVQNAGAASPLPLDISSAYARSATATACCSSPTRSSVPSGASVIGSDPCATATNPTSSRWRRASPLATRRWAP